MQAPLQPSSTSTSRAELDRAVERLKAAAPRFARLDLPARLALFSRIADHYFEQLPDMVQAGCAAKGLDPHGPAAGEEWLAHGLSIARYLRLMRQSLTDLLETGAPRFDARRLRRRPSGGLALQVYPATTLEALAFPGIQAEVYFHAGLTEEALRERQAPFYRSPHGGRVALVLGAGNVASIPPKDALHKMFVEGEVTLLKMNPVNQYLGPYLEKIFAPAIEEGYFALAYGGGEVGAHLAQHPDVDSIHITGSDKTHDLIVWGPPGPEREARKARGEPVLKKEITSELGNISAVLVVPGPWTAEDLDFQGRNLAGMVANNASFNCNAAKLLVQPTSWTGAGKLLASVEAALAQTPTRLAYYPGAEERYHSFTANRPFVREVGAPGPGELPWAVIRHLDADDPSEPLFRNEPWCSLLGETELGSDDPAVFLRDAVKFANERLWGTLNIALLVHPRTLRDPIVAAAVEEAIEELRYGTVAVNLWPAAGFTLATTPWGGHPSSTLANIQSGRGWSGNTLMLEGIEKSVLRAPFRMSPKPVWFPDHRTVGALGRKVTELERSASWRKLPAVAFNALRG